MSGVQTNRGLVPFSVVVAGLAVAALVVVVGYVLVQRAEGGIQVTPDYTLEAADPEMGPILIQKYGCGACHEVAGVKGARGKVGPNLNETAERAYLAGNLPNTPDNLVRWIQAPQMIQPGTAMPDLGVTESDARHIAAYLYTLD